MITIESRAVRGALLLTAALVALPAPAHAQLGKLRKKVAQTVAGTTGAEQTTAADSNPIAAPTGSTRSPYGEHVLEITEPVLARFEQGLAAESERRTEVAAILANIPTREARAACEQRVAAGPEMQALLQEYLAAIEKAGENTAEMMKAAEKMDRDSRAIYGRECGEVLSPELEREYQEAPGIAGAEAARFTKYQYGVIRERIAPLCSAGDRLAPTATGAAVPAGGGVSYVYSAAEVSLLMPRCTDLMRSLEASS